MRVSYKMRPGSLWQSKRVLREKRRQGPLQTKRGQYEEEMSASVWILSRDRRLAEEAWDLKKNKPFTFIIYEPFLKKI